MSSARNFLMTIGIFCLVAAALAQPSNQAATPPQSQGPSSILSPKDADAAGKHLDLLKLVKLPDDAVTGHWRMTSDGLETEGKVGRQPANLAIRYAPGAEFRLSVTFTLGDQDSVGFGFPFRDGHSGAYFNIYRTGANVWGSPKSDEVRHPLEANKKHTVEVLVRGGAITATADRQEVLTRRLGLENAVKSVGSVTYPPGTILLETHVRGKVVFHSAIVYPLPPLPGKPQPANETHNDNAGKQPVLVNASDLKLGGPYRLSKGAPWMPSIDPSPRELAACGPSRMPWPSPRVPPGGSIVVLKSAEGKRGVLWYRVVTYNAADEQVGHGWINSTALLGQAVEKSTSDPTNTLAYALATINSAEGHVAKEDITVTRFAYLLRSIESKTSNTTQQIAEMSDAAVRALREEYGRDVGLLDFMEGMNRALPSGKKSDYGPVVDLYMQELKK